MPLAGIAIGVTGLVRAVAEEEERLNFNLQPLHGIDEGYDTPLRSLPAAAAAAATATATAIATAAVAAAATGSSWPSPAGRR